MTAMSAIVESVLPCASTFAISSSLVPCSSLIGVWPPLTGVMSSLHGTEQRKENRVGTQERAEEIRNHCMNRRINDSIDGEVRVVGTPKREIQPDRKAWATASVVMLVRGMASGKWAK